MTSNKRIKWLDFAKGLTIFLVVLAHCTDPQGHTNFYINLIYYILFLIMMPAFFSISGFLYKKVSTIKAYLLLIYKKVISLLMPYFFISIIITFGKRLYGYNIPLTDCVLGFKTSIALWFLPALFIIFMIIGLMDLVHINLFIQLFFMLILLFIQPEFYILNNLSAWGSHLIIYRTISYSIFFYLGIIIKKYFIPFIHENVNKLNIINALLFILLIFIQLKFTNILFPTNNVGIATIFSKIISVFIIFGISIKWVKYHGLNFFLNYGKYTLIIYLLNHPIITLINFYIRKINYIKYLNVMPYTIIVFVLTVLIVLGVCYLSKHLNVINFLFYPRKYISKLLIKTRFGKYLLKQ